MIFNVSGGAVKVFYIVGRIGNSGYGNVLCCGFTVIKVCDF